jgi:AraC family transcriptional regulator
MLAPGAILLGNHGHCFECGHEHATGDRCISFMFEPTYFEAILSAIPNTRSETFRVPRLPPLMDLTRVIAAAELAREDNDPGTWEEVALGFAGRVVAILADQDGTAPVATSREEKRIVAALRRIQMEAHHPITLADLAQDAAVSRYHFLRTFRQVVG